jgi:LysM repeat protein
LISEREKLEFDSVPEFVREPRSSARDSYSANIASSSDELDIIRPTSKHSSTALPKSAELEALWPGVSHEFLHSAPRRGPSFYLCIGFMAGAICSMVAICGYSAVTQIAANKTAGTKEILVAQGQAGVKGSVVDSRGTGVTTLSTTSGEPEVIVPLNPTYEVGSGDTLAAIALKNYKRATPRLLDEICKANNMRNANVLNLGQKLALPEYRPQSSQIATGANTIQQ